MLHDLSNVSQRRSHVIFFGLALLFALLLVAYPIPTVNAQSADNFCAAGEVPQFRFGFAAFKQQMGAKVGDPVECEHYDGQGNAYQKTTTGELFYNKSTGQITLTPNATASVASTDNFCAPGEQPEFRFGFAALKQEMGAAIGEPIECEHHDEQGNAYQKTTRGELYYDKSTGRIIFTPTGPQGGSPVAPPTTNPSTGPGASSPPANCSLSATVSNTEGPYYKANAPVRNVLVEPGMAGTRLVLTGRVLTTDCQPVAGALLDFWQTDANGNYDNAGYRLRGRQYADAQGNYRLETVLPGLYTGRTMHIHVKVSQPGGRVLTTQIYFNGVTQNQYDGIYTPSLAITLTDGSDGSKQGTFDFVLAQ